MEASSHSIPKNKTFYFHWFQAAYNQEIIYCIILSSRMFVSPLVSFWDTFPFVQCVLFGSLSICQISPGIRSTVYVHTACSEISSGFFFFNYFVLSTPGCCGSLASVWETPHYRRPWITGTQHMANDHVALKCADVSIMHERKRMVKTITFDLVEGLVNSFISTDDLW